MVSAAPRGVVHRPTMAAFPWDRDEVEEVRRDKHGSGCEQKVTELGALAREQ